ncbi:TPA: DUF551 domain-containing protein [Enterobacter hormaechei]|uniref:DUF551 domain-containing protein n=1 Tax=Enterobacter hormaechei TaxID=158836 RepID=UPI00125C177B|nr:DUF551 domain-containing protein [Enterobacter hormaechei]VAC12304.1 Protein of uncharacterised function (DUF551) [Enterobacter hormaechei]HCL8933163.1 DUF551 domain-containing protein [Enterobacter hormaechei]HED1501323.1 DUF551 domain-containing protein [Enterobacter hormaechei subsp. hoffmannii]
MSTITKEWLESQISAIKAVGITDSNTLQAFEIALASLEAEPAIHRWRRVTFEPYGPYPWHYGNFIGFSKPVDGIEDEYYYAAPPAPVSVPAAMEMDDDFDSAFEHGKAVGWNAYRAAMLQSFGNSEQLNSPVIPDGWVACSERMPEKADEVLCAKEFDGPGDWRQKVGYYLAGKWTVYSASWTPTHWMPLPSAPQQEA